MLAKIAAHRRYPELARQQGLEGKVSLSFRVRDDGRVTDLAIVRGVDPLLDEAAKDAVFASAPLPRSDELLTVELDFRLDE